MKILAFDISSRSTGYSVFKRDRLLKKSCGIIKLNPKHSHGKRLQHFEQSIKEIIRYHNPDEIIIEDIFKGRNIATFKILSLFRGVAIKAIYDELEKDPTSVMASEARKIVGVKNDKEEAYKFVVEKYNLFDYKFNSHNDITDSIVLGLCGHIMQKNGIDPEQLKKTRKRKRRKKSKKK